VVLPDDDLEMQLLSVFARTARQGVDRRGETHAVDHATGLPLSSNDLLPRYKAVSGTSLALQLIVVPRQLASGILRRPVDEGAPVALGSIPPHEWTRQEAELVGALEEQLRHKVHQLAERHGWFNVAAEEYEPGCPLVGEDGMTVAFKITYKGLQHAIEKVKGTKYELGAVSPQHDLGDAKWRAAPQWAQAEHRGV